MAARHDQIFVMNPKGGCGKTTIAAQLAGYYAKLGKRVLLADHDAQKSSSDWIASRPDDVAPISCMVLKPEAELATADAEVVIHDMPAAWTLKHVDGLLQAGDRLLIPVLPSPTDIKACLRFIMGLYRDGVMDSGAQIGLIANRVRKNTRYFAVLDTFLHKLDIPVIGQLRDTQNYLRLMDRGLSIFDVNTKYLYRDKSEWLLVLDWLDIDTDAERGSVFTADQTVSAKPQAASA